MVLLNRLALPAITKSEDLNALEEALKIKRSLGGKISVISLLFIYERDKNMPIRRIEHKLGIHGSPTCELQFNIAPAELPGQRKLGLIKYTMSLLNGARLAIATQAMCIDALKSERKKKVTQVFANKALPRCKAAVDYILADDNSLVQHHEEIID